MFPQFRPYPSKSEENTQILQELSSQEVRILFMGFFLDYFNQRLSLKELIHLGQLFSYKQNHEKDAAVLQIFSVLNYLQRQQIAGMSTLFTKQIISKTLKQVFLHLVTL